VVGWPNWAAYAQPLKMSKEMPRLGQLRAPKIADSGPREDF
jgi:hypothetical protein